MAPPLDACGVDSPIESEVTLLLGYGVAVILSLLTFHIAADCLFLV